MYNSWNFQDNPETTKHESCRYDAYIAVTDNCVKKSNIVGEKYDFSCRFFVNIGWNRVNKPLTSKIADNFYLNKY